MISHYWTFEDNDNNTIPNCEIDAGEGVKVDGAFENDASDWVQLNKVYLTVVKLVNDRWEYYGVYSWAGAVALKAGQMYDIKSDAAILTKGTYGLLAFSFETAPQTSGLFYKDGLFDLKFTR